MYCSITGALLTDVEANSLTLKTFVIFPVSILGFYSYTVERIIEAEESIRDQYNNLEWYTAPFWTKKLLLIAMQRPQEVTFGGVFSKDKTSLARFAAIVHQAYGFGLILIQAKNLT